MAITVAQLLCVRVSLLWYRAPRTYRDTLLLRKHQYTRLLIFAGIARLRCELLVVVLIAGFSGVYTQNLHIPL
jgi:hypothetical protein